MLLRLFGRDIDLHLTQTSALLARSVQSPKSTKQLSSAVLWYAGKSLTQLMVKAELYFFSVFSLLILKADISSLNTLERATEHESTHIHLAAKCFITTIGCFDCAKVLWAAFGVELNWICCSLRCKSESCCSVWVDKKSFKVKSFEDRRVISSHCHVGGRKTNRENSRERLKSWLIWPAEIFIKKLLALDFSRTAELSFLQALTKEFFN